MAKNTLLKQVIQDQREQLQEISALTQYVSRELPSNPVNDIFSQGPGVIVIQGVRRCGKSTYATNILNAPFAYINFDDERLFNLQAKDLGDLLAACYELYGSDLQHFIFDEIQNITGWELFINRLEKTKKIIITGSNSNLLSKELATHLTGRYKSLKLYPFSFREFINLKLGKKAERFSDLSTKQLGEYRTLLSEYIEEGGFPDAQRYGSNFSQTIYSDIISKDIVQRYRLRTPANFRKFAHYIISNCASELSLNKTGRALGIKDPHTAAKYLSYLEDAFLVFPVNKYFHKLRSQLASNKKIYAIDTGLVHNIAFRPTSLLSSHFEHLVFLELIRQRDYHHLIDDIYLWKGERAEVDFITRSKGKITSAIQVSLDISNVQTFERETKALFEVAEELGVKNLFLINDSVRDTIERNGKKIEILPMLEWLLDRRETTFS